MGKGVIPEESYSKLLKIIKDEIAEGLLRAQRAYSQEKIICYWRVGKAINNHLLENNNRASYGKQLYSRLSLDLGIGERLLYQMNQFYSVYPDLEPLQDLNWSHYRLLTSIKDNEQRHTIEVKAANDKWSKRALEAFIKDAKEKVGSPKSKPRKPRKLSLNKGKLYTYSTFKDPCADNIMIDCGFNVYYESNMSKFKGSMVKTVKTDNSYKLVKTTATNKQLYTYKAYVKKIIDGDTLWVTIDCGFRIWISQKLRLRGIDTPGITTNKGVEAYKFVCRELKDLPFIIIKSHWRDKFDRYLSDIIYLKGENDPQAVLDKGIFLNQRLLDENLATRSTT